MQPARGPIRNTRDLEALPERSQAARKGALTVIARARHEHITIAEAIRRERMVGHHISTESVHRYGGPAIARGPGGRLVPTPYDRLFRRLPILTPDGVVEADVRSSRRASLIGEYRNAVRAFLEGDDPTGAGLRRFRGKGAGGHIFLTDFDALEAWANRAEPDELNQEGS